VGRVLFSYGFGPFFLLAATWAAFACLAGLVLAGAALRVVAPALPAYYLQALVAAGLAWAAAFVIFLFVHMPILFCVRGAPIR
jgi:uncharacterized protein involved in response to NO